MYCAGCGAKITKTDEVCPHCGAVNQNFCGKRKQEKSKRGRKPLLWILAGLLLLSAGAAALLLMHQKSYAERAAYDPEGLSSWQTAEGVISFVEEDGEVIEFGDGAVSGHSTPDHTRFLVLREDDGLSLETRDGERKKIADGVEKIDCVSDFGCYYFTRDRFFFYDFKTGDTVNLGDSTYNRAYSLGNYSVAFMTEDGTISSFTAGQSEAKRLCQASEEANIKAISKDGSRVFWIISKDDRKDLEVYTMRKEIPEKIVTFDGKDIKLFGTWFFGDGNDCFLYAMGDKKLLICHDEQIQEVNLPGILVFNGISDQNGEASWIEYAEDKDVYVVVEDSPGSGVLCRVSFSGEVTPVVRNLGADSTQVIREKILTCMVHASVG